MNPALSPLQGAQFIAPAFMPGRKSAPRRGYELSKHPLRICRTFQSSAWSLARRFFAFTSHSTPFGLYGRRSCLGAGGLVRGSASARERLRRRRRAMGPAGAQGVVAVGQAGAGAAAAVVDAGVVLGVAVVPAGIKGVDG